MSGELTKFAGDKVKDVLMSICSPYDDNFVVVEDNNVYLKYDRLELDPHTETITYFNGNIALAYRPCENLAKHLNGGKMQLDGGFEGRVKVELLW